MRCEVLAHQFTDSGPRMHTGLTWPKGLGGQGEQEDCLLRLQALTQPRLGVPLPG